MTQSINEFINDKGVWRTAAATPSLLMTKLFVEQLSYTGSAKYSYETEIKFVLRKHDYISKTEVISTSLFCFLAMISKLTSQIVSGCKISPTKTTYLREKLFQ